jgi:hypothetical protein
MRLLTFLTFAIPALAQLDLKTHFNTAALSKPFNPVKEAYWTGYPHHRRTPFALSPDGSTAYLVYLDASETDVHIQSIDPKTFEATGSSVTVKGAKEAGGLVAHDDGFALLTNEALAAGTVDAPPDNTPVPVLYRFTAGGEQSWKTYLGGPAVTGSDLLASPDLNGDLVFSSEAGYYAAYFVVTSYSGSASGHFGDAIRYVTPDGSLEDIPGASSSWGCSHNTGIAFEAADAPPFASICAEDQGAIWLNTETQGMGNNGVKISNEVVINGGSNEPVGGTSGSYSSIARFIGQSSYIFSWVSRGAVDLTENEWMGAGYTKSQNRTSNRNVAIALFSDKATLVGEQATSQVGAADGDKQINWITQGSADCSNAHAATFDGSNALVSWEEIADPICDFVAMGCRGDFTGTFYQAVNEAGDKVGEPVKSTDSYVAGDMVTMPDGRICWPFVDMEWRLDAPARSLPSSETTEMSFACIGNGDSGSNDSETSPGTSTAEELPSTTSSQSSQVETQEPSATATDVDVSTTSVPEPTTEADASATSAPETAVQTQATESTAVTGTVSEAAPPAASVTLSSIVSKTCPPKTVWTTFTVYA